LNIWNDQENERLYDDETDEYMESMEECLRRLLNLKLDKLSQIVV